MFFFWDGIWEVDVHGDCQMILDVEVLSHKLKSAAAVSYFKSRLKTHLFSQVFGLALLGTTTVVSILLVSPFNENLF